MEVADFGNIDLAELNKSRLPEGYTECEYVRSILPGGRNTSTLYVDLQVAGINGCRVRGSFDVMESDHSMYGARNQWTTTRFGCTLASESSHNFYFMHANGHYEFASDTNIHFIDDNCSKLGYCLIDDREPIKLDTGGSVSSRNLYLFNDNSAPGGDYGGACTIYMAEFYKDQILVCYPIPCKRDSDGVAGFYDIVNKKFLTAVVRKGSAYLKAGPVLNKYILKITHTKTGVILWQKTK